MMIEQNKTYTFEIIETHASGKFFTVQFARAFPEGNLVTLKILNAKYQKDEQLKEQIRQRYALQSALEHPNIRRIYQVLEENGALYIIQEHLPGKTLAEVFKSTYRSLDWLETLKSVQQLLSALSHTHSLGVFHNNLQPDSIYLNPDNRLVLDGFGKLDMAWESQEPVTGQVSQVLYLAPEQLNGLAVNASADIYSAGIIIYQMLTNRLPWHIADPVNPLASKQKTLSSPVLDPSFFNQLIPYWLFTILRRALQIDVDKRFQTIAEFQLALLEQKEISTFIKPAPKPEPIPQVPPPAALEPPSLPLPEPEPAAEPEPVTGQSVVVPAEPAIEPASEPEEPIEPETPFVYTEEEESPVSEPEPELDLLVSEPAEPEPYFTLPPEPEPEPIQPILSHPAPAEPEPAVISPAPEPEAIQPAPPELPPAPEPEPVTPKETAPIQVVEPVAPIPVVIKSPKPQTPPVQPKIPPVTPPVPQPKPVSSDTATLQKTFRIMAIICGIIVLLVAGKYYWQHRYRSFHLAPSDSLGETKTAETPPPKYENQPLELLKIKGGKAILGSMEAGAGDDEFPLFEINVKDFWMSRTEVTQKEWQMVYGTNPSQMQSPNQPVENITFFEAVEFCNAKSENDGYLPCYSFNEGQLTCDFRANGYRLPTEAEWEFAAKECNAEYTFPYAGGLYLDSLGWFQDNSRMKAHPVGKKKPNNLGLYDLTGNVSEWVWNWYLPYSNGAAQALAGPDKGNEKVFRGGSWADPQPDLRLTNRWHQPPWFKSPTIGLRVVRSL